MSNQKRIPKVEAYPTIENMRTGFHPINKKVKTRALQTILYIHEEDYIPYPISVYKTLPKPVRKQALLSLKMMYPKMFRK